MEYKVMWSPNAQAEISRLGAIDELQKLLLLAVNRIDAQLGARPREVGIMRLVSTRMLVEKPLGIVYDIIEDDKVVYIASVWLTK